jgi:hypothetical protein
MSIRKRLVGGSRRLRVVVKRDVTNILKCVSKKGRKPLKSITRKKKAMSEDMNIREDK